MKARDYNREEYEDIYNEHVGIDFLPAGCLDTDALGECDSCLKKVPRDTMHFSSGYKNGVGDGLFCCACALCSGCGEPAGEEIPPTPHERTAEAFGRTA